MINYKNMNLPNLHECPLHQNEHLSEEEEITSMLNNYFQKYRNNEEFDAEEISFLCRFLNVKDEEFLVYLNKNNFIDIIMKYFKQIKSLQTIFDILRFFNNFYSRNNEKPKDIFLDYFISLFYSIEIEDLNYEIMINIIIEVLKSIQFYVATFFLEHFEPCFFDQIDEIFGVNVYLDKAICKLVLNFILSDIDIMSQVHIMNFIKYLYKDLKNTHYIVTEQSQIFYYLLKRYPELNRYDWVHCIFFNLLIINNDNSRNYLYKILYKIPKEYFNYYINFDIINCISDTISRVDFPEITTSALKVIYHFFQVDLKKSLDFFFSNDYDNININFLIINILFNGPFHMKKISAYIYLISLRYLPNNYLQSFKINSIEEFNNRRNNNNGFKAIYEIIDLNQTDILLLAIEDLDFLINIFQQEENQFNCFLNLVDYSGIKEQILGIINNNSLEENNDILIELIRRSKILINSYFKE